MKIAVCVKQVPDTEARLRVGADGTWIDEEGVAFVLNESDEYAVEEALQIGERTGGEVIAFCLGPERSREALRKVLALGAARAVSLSDPALLGGDALATGRALAAAIRQEGADLVLTGSASSDLGYAATGSVIAGELGWPHAWLVMGVELAEDRKSVRITREMEGGMNERSAVALPAVIQVQAGINHPRYASLKGIMAAKKKEIREVAAADLGVDAGRLGRAGSRLETVAVALPESGREVEWIAGDAAAVAATLVTKLEKEAKVLR
jgi:electron transfer flavoprotein beta subunit